MSDISKPVPRFRVARISSGGFTVEDTRTHKRIGLFATIRRAERQARLQELTAQLFPTRQEQRP